MKKEKMLRLFKVLAEYILCMGTLLLIYFILNSLRIIKKEMGQSSLC